MTIKVFGLKTCDTCRKARNELEASGQDVEFIDIRADADLASSIPRWLAAVGDKLVHRSSTTWRGLSEEDKARASGASVEGLLLGNPTLIKRPVIDTGTEILVGWTPATKARLG